MNKGIPITRAKTITLSSTTITRLSPGSSFFLIGAGCGTPEVGVELFSWGGFTAKRGQKKIVSQIAMYIFFNVSFESFQPGYHYPVHRRCFIFLFVLFENIGERARKRIKNIRLFSSSRTTTPFRWRSPALDGLWGENRGSSNRLGYHVINSEVTCTQNMTVLYTDHVHRRLWRKGQKCIAF